MLQKSKVRISKVTLLPACVIGVSAALIVSAGGALIGAICILNEYIDITAATVVIIVTQFLASITGSLLSGTIAKESKILSCCLTVCIYYFVLLGAAMLFFDGVGGGVLTGMIVCTLSCFCGFLLSTSKKNNRKHKRKGKRTC